VLATLLGACGMLPQRADTPYSAALAAAPDSPLVSIAQASIPSPELSGFRLMPIGVYALDARVQLAQRARHSIDAQYYQLNNDDTGRLFLRNLRDAARRGVRVRLLVDDLYTTGGDLLFIGLASFPNVEVRLFNPFCCGRQSLLGKYTTRWPISDGSTIACTTSCSSPTARWWSLADATSATSISCAA